jgi:hypothetical protein
MPPFPAFLAPLDLTGCRTTPKPLQAVLAPVLHAFDKFAVAFLDATFPIFFGFFLSHWFYLQLRVLTLYYRIYDCSVDGLHAIK